MVDELLAIRESECLGTDIEVSRQKDSVVASIKISQGGIFRALFHPDCKQIQSLEIQLTLGHCAKADISVVSYRQNRERFCCKTFQRHQGNESRSTVEFRCVAGDYAQIDYQGSIEIPVDVHNVCAEQRCRGLVLSDAAKISAIPAMCVASKDADSFHGVAIGGMDPEILGYFYLRGISYNVAKSLYIDGFLM